MSAGSATTPSSPVAGCRSRPRPSALEGDAWTYDGMQPYSTPRALATDEIAGVVAQFRHGAELAMARRLRRRRDPRRQRLPDRPVPARRHQPAHRPLRRQRREPRALPARGDRGRGRRLGCGSRRRAPVAAGQLQRHVRQRPGHHVRCRGRGAGRLRPRLPAPGRAVRAGEADRRASRPSCAASASAGTAPTSPTAPTTPSAGREAVASGWATAVAYGVPFLANPDLPLRFLTGGELNARRQGDLLRRRRQGLCRLPGRGRRALRRLTNQRRCLRAAPLHHQYCAIRRSLA